jgi:hypothetical protein
VQIKGAPGGMKFMRHGDHRGHADAATHQETARGLGLQREMIGRPGDEDLATRREDTVQKGRSALPLVLAQHGNVAARAVGRVAHQRILAQLVGADHDIKMRAGLPRRQIASLRGAQHIARHRGRQAFRLSHQHLQQKAFILPSVFVIPCASLARGAMLAAGLCRDHCAAGRDPGLARSIG